ncbi:B-cell lymphoma/leukemia 10 [Cynoglossus semilaevis]|uniref:BCL10 immune signaling adaptor n=1 Tax=Cynoglossus semilaevis TaxID=244447 RepID=A0A3P8VU12_CYNSE|nr:B-cell lymphoma/leukemia 10 [Cynoglossus semilaevis]
MDVPQLSEDEMADIKKEVLITMRHYLCLKIRAERHLDFLRSCRILTRDDAEEISCRTTQSKRTAMLLDYLAENPRGLDALIDSIREMRSQSFLITKITDEVQKAKNERLESLKARASSSSSDTKVNSPSMASDLPTSFANNSTLLFHPEGERSASNLEVPESLNVPSVQKGEELCYVSVASIPVVSSSTSLSLPRPGDPGAPPVPDEGIGSPSSIDPTSPGCTSAAGDSQSANFQPLRSRSLTPTSQGNIF